MRKLFGALLLLGALVGLWTTAVVTQTVQCGGSFVPSLNCIVSGRWNFNNTTTSAGLTSQGPIPFQAGGTDVTGIISRVTTLTHTQILGLNAAAGGVTVVEAPGAGYYVDVISVNLIFNYTTAYTSGSDLRLYYGGRQSGNAASATITASGLIVSVTADATNRVAGVPDNTDPPTTNLAVVIQQVDSTAFASGSALNTLRVVVNYRIVTTGL